MFRVKPGSLNGRRFFVVSIASEPLGSDALGLVPGRLFVPDATGRIKCPCEKCSKIRWGQPGERCAEARALLEYLARWWSLYVAFEGN